MISFLVLYRRILVITFIRKKDEAVCDRLGKPLSQDEVHF